MSQSNGSPLHSVTRPRTNSRPSIDSSYSCVDLTAELQESSPTALGGGTFSDVYKYQDRHANPPVYYAIKSFRYHHCYNLDREKTEKRIKREIDSWGNLRHPNILRLEGILYRSEVDNDRFPCLVSPWMHNGTARQYCANRIGVNLLEFVSGIADGILYMHQKGIAHGDIRGDNVLVSDSGQAMICDFGLSKISESLTAGQTASSVAGHGAVRYCAPEFFTRGLEKPTPSGDVWMFGMTFLELWSGRIPFSLYSDPQVINMLAKQEIPDFSGFTAERSEFRIFKERVLSICSLCWIINPIIRPSMETIASLIRVLTAEKISFDLLAREEFIHQFQSASNSIAGGSRTTENQYAAIYSPTLQANRPSSRRVSVEVEEGRTSPAYEEYVPVNQHLSPARSFTGSDASSYPSPVSDDRSEVTTSHADGETSPLSFRNSPSTTIPSRSGHAPSTQPELTPYTNGNNRTGSGGSQLVADEVGLLPLFAAPPPLPPTTESMLNDTSIGHNEILHNYLGRDIDALEFEDSNTMSERAEMSFTVICKVRQIEYGRGHSKSKVDAKRDASKQAVMRLYAEDREGITGALQYYPRFENHLRINNLIHRIQWVDNLKNDPDGSSAQALIWICNFTVDGTSLAQGKGTVRQRAKENAARNAASLWIEFMQRPQP